MKRRQSCPLKIRILSVALALGMLAGCRSFSSGDKGVASEISSTSHALQNSSQASSLAVSVSLPNSFEEQTSSLNSSQETLHISSERQGGSSQQISSRVSSQTTDQISSKQTQQESPPVQVKPISGETRAVWISQFDLQNVLKSGSKQRPEKDFTNLIGKILDNVRNYGFNTVFVQARPYSDSFYPSAYFPWSNMVVGSFGKEADYDPYQIIVKEARKRELSIHGWVNPLRGMKDAELKQIPDQYPIKKWYNDPQKRKNNLVLKDGRWYYNSSAAEVRQLIADGAKELLQKYSLDGIHIDDYFYYSDSLENVSKMIQGIYRAVKSVNPQAQFGVSPEGNVVRDYSVHFADVMTWCAKKGYIDYICPQIYYGLEHATWDFTKTVTAWNSFITKESGVYLLAGMTLGKAGNEDAWAGTTGKNEWKEHDDIIKRCILETRKQNHAKGIAIFCYQYLFDPITGNAVDRTMAEVNNFLPLFQGK